MILFRGALEKYGVKVDRRTIQRYIKMLKECGYNVISEEYENSNYHQKSYYISDEINEIKPDDEKKLLNSQDMFVNIEAIHDAIRRKQKIKIWFMEYDDIKGKLKKYIKKNKEEHETYESINAIYRIYQ